MVGQAVRIERCFEAGQVAGCFGKAACVAKMGTLETYPRSLGAYISMATTAKGIAIVAYDGYHGNLVGLIDRGTLPWERVIIDGEIGKRKISDVGKGGRISIPGRGLKEPYLHNDDRTGSRDFVLPGNRDFVPGDAIPRPDGGGGQGQGRQLVGSQFRPPGDGSGQGNRVTVMGMAEGSQFGNRAGGQGLQFGVDQRPVGAGRPADGLGRVVDQDVQRAGRSH